MSKTCPVCSNSFSTAAQALRCWLSHDPDLSTTLSLREMGEPLGVTRERIRQILTGMGENRRARKWPTFVAPKGTRIVRPASPANAAEVQLKPGERRPQWMTAEQDPRRKARRRARHRWRLANDPSYHELLRAKRRRKLERRRARAIGQRT